MLFIESTLPLHTDRFDVLHDLLQQCFTVHGHVRGHQDQLLGVGQLLHDAHFLFMVLEKSRIMYSASTLSLSADRFDVLHALLQPCNALHGHGHGNHDQLLGLGQLGIDENLLMYIVDVSEGLLIHFKPLNNLNIA